MALDKTPTQSRAVNWLNSPYWWARTLAEDWVSYRRGPLPRSASSLGDRLSGKVLQPIFLIGAARTGTTFLGECLAALPEVSYHFEPVGTKAAVYHVYDGRWSYERARRFYRCLYGWLLRIHLDGHLRFAEKTPRNCFIVGFLRRAFPDAQFVSIQRDGRDAALSNSKRPWLQAAYAGSGRRDPAGYLYGPYAQFWVEPERREEFESTTDIHRCIWAWRRYTESARADLQGVPPEQHHELRYEDLVTNPAEEAERLLAFLGITDSESRASFHQTVAKANPRSVGAGRRELTDAQLDQIEREAGGLLQRLGYGS
ncbi:MAG: sulfotransferase [bacterium]|nr:sulfotransferase [bacterium]